MQATQNNLDLFAFIDTGMSLLIDAQFKRRAYAHLYRGSKSAWELLICDSPNIRGQSCTRIRIDGDKNDARRIAARFNAVCWNF